MTGIIPEPRELRPNPDWAKLPIFDRRDWTRVRFGDVVQNVKETERDPAKAGIERFIGLEHLEQGSLHVRSWGNVADGTTFTRRCRPGQVLFGKRRAYQRKVAVAEFEAVVSGDIYVFAPKDERLLPELLPFLCMSERFFQYAVETSAGSLSPRTNWKHLAQFGFDLPPLGKQRRIAEMLWAADEVVQRASALETAAQSLADASLADFLYNNEQWRQSECRDILADNPRNGFSPPSNAGRRGLPTLSISAIRGGNVIIEGNVKFASANLGDIYQFQLKSGDILVVRGNGNRSLCGKAGIVQRYPDGCFYPDLLIRLLFKPDAMLQEFAVMQWNEPKTHSRLISKAKSTNGIWKINGQDIKLHRLAVPPIAAQKRFLSEIESKNALVKRAKEFIAEGIDLLKRMTDVIFEAAHDNHRI